MVELLPNTSNQLTKPSAVDCFQVRSISEARFVNRIGMIDPRTLEQIQVALAAVLSITR